MHKIYDPITSNPAVFPSIERPRAEFEFPHKIAEWIKARDGHDMFPVLDENRLFVRYAEVDTLPLEAHHITPIYYYKMFNPDGYVINEHQTPLNGITLGHKTHLYIHSAWKKDLTAEYQGLPFVGKRAMNVDAYIALQTAQGRPAWWNHYDRELYAIATIRSYEMLINRKDDVSAKFEPLIRHYYEKLWEKMTPFCESYYGSLKSANYRIWDTAKV